MGTESTTITEFWYSLDHDELAAVIQEVASTDNDDDFDAAKAYSEVRATLDRNYQSMLDAGYSESELAGMTVADFMDAERIAQQLQGAAGNGTVGDNLVKSLRGAARGKSVRVAAKLSGLSPKQVRSRLDGTAPLTVDEAAQLAVAYGITTGELLGIVDADEVRLLRAWRSMDESKRGALLTLLE